MQERKTVQTESESEIQTKPDYSNVICIDIQTPMAISDYREALELANGEAEIQAEDTMLLSSYDRDKNSELPHHAGECHANSDIPGYIDYALYHGASLKVDLNEGQYVFFYYII